MKKILFTSLAVLGLGITGCSNEDLGVAKSGVDEVCATMGDAESRTAMNGNSVVWSTGDEIGIFVTNGSSSTYTNTNYSLSSGAGTKNAEFSGVLEGDNPVKKAAFYPYGSDASYDGSKISLTLKDTYNYKEGENSSALMACQINESAQDVLAFKNAGALMSVTVNNIPKDYIWAKLTSMTAQGKTTAPAIAGNAQIAFAEGIPTLTTTGTLNSSSITINFTAGNDVTSKTFYFPLPVAEYPALELSIGNGATSQVLKTKALDAKRNERYTTTITLDEVSGSVPTTVGSVSAVVNALATTNSVSVTDVAPTEASPTVSIPKKNTPAENVSISFENISTTATVAIKEASTGASGNSAPENVLVSVPQLDTAPKFEIELPSSTVTLAANGETATYDEVTATTAANTLVLDKGITVNTLKVKAGNVRVKSGAKVTAISRESGNTSTVIIYKEEGAELPNLSGNDAFEVVDAAVADLQNVAKNGGTYTLATDLTGDFTISATNEVIINLNGHKITNKSGDTFTVNKDSKLTINGNGTVDNVSHGKACIYNNGTVILNDGTYIRSKENGQNSESSGGNSYYNILNHGEMTINPNVEISQNGHYTFDVPNGWNWCKLNDLCSFLSRGKSPKYSEDDKTYPVFAQKCNLKEGGISLEQARFLDPSTINKWDSKYKLQTGDVLVNSTGTGTVGRTRLFDESYLGKYPFVVPDSHVSVVRTYEEINSEYVFAYMSSQLIQQYIEDNLAGSTNQKELYIGVLENLYFPFPPINEQQRIVQKIEELFSVLDNIQNALEV